MSQHIKLSLNSGVRKILINRPEKKNALSPQMYEKLAEVLNEDARNDEVRVTIITGAGDYYSSGNDMKGAMESGGNLELPRKLVQAFIDYPKIIIAVLNGPAIGIAATTAALCDIIYASDKAYFDTPFIRLGLCAEGASSYNLPRIIGRSKASEALLLGKQISAEEAYRLGLISAVIPHEKVDAFIQSLYKYGSLSLNGIKINKKLIMQNLSGILTEANNREVEALDMCIASGEFQRVIVEMMQKKSKL